MNTIPQSKEITLIMGRSMLTLPYLNKKDYTWNQLLNLQLLFKNNLIAVYSENHPKEYDEALKFFNPKSIIDLCDLMFIQMVSVNNLKKLLILVYTNLLKRHTI
jgi:hypothetical protein